MTTQVTNRKFSELTTKFEKLDHIRLKLTFDKTWQARALVVLYDYQTRDEKDAGNTRHHNRRGFNSNDGKYCSSVAQQINNRLKYYPNTKLEHTVSDLQSTRLSRILPKYAAQLLRIMNGSN